MASPPKRRTPRTRNAPLSRGSWRARFPVHPGLVAAAVFMVLLGYGLIRGVPAGWESTTGTVVSIRSRYQPARHEPGNRVTLVYRYRAADGNAYRGLRESRMEDWRKELTVSRFRPDSPLPVYYDPGSPWRSVPFVAPRRKLSALTVAGALGLLLGLGWAARDLLPRPLAPPVRSRKR